MTTTLPTDSADRKDVPLARGLLDYFPAALAAVARLSLAGNEKHNPGEELHHARGKSSDHADCILRHLAERGTYDEDGFLHDVKVAWRALAQLQEALEACEDAPFPRGARPEFDEYLDNPEVAAMREKIRVAVLGVLDEDCDEDDPVEVDAYGRVTRCSPPVNIDGEEFEVEEKVANWDVVDYLDTLDGFGNVDALDEERDETVVDSLYCSNAISNRIAGDTDEAKAIKNPYYNHDPHLIVGYCANCDRELKVDDEHIKNAPDFEASLIFCGLACRTELLCWQGRTR